MLLHLHSVRGKISRQLNLDSCSGYFALQAKNLTLKLIVSHHRLDIARTATLAACATVIVCPKAEATFLTYLKVEGIFQRILKTRWELLHQQWQFLTPKECPSFLGARKSTFPSFPLRIVGADLSELPRFSTPRDPIRFSFLLSKSNQQSEASVIERTTNSQEKLYAAWTQ